MKESNERQSHFELFSNLRPEVLAFYFNSLAAMGEEVTMEKIDIVNKVWSDIEDHFILTGGDFNYMVNIAIEALVESALADEGEDTE